MEKKLVNAFEDIVTKKQTAIPHDLISLCTKNMN